MPLQATSGAASYDAFGGGVAAGPANYIEDVFSTYVYTGTDGQRTITNNIDLLGNGGMVWSKSRTTPGGSSPDNIIVSGPAGASAWPFMNPKYLITNSTAADFPTGSAIDAFTSSGYRIASSAYGFNELPVNYVSWTFREQPKFFDVVTWTGDGAAQKTIPHNLGSAPGFIMAKSTSDTANWTCYHRSLGEGKYIRINTTGAAVTSANAWININATTFDAYDFINQSGSTYVAYVFAHNAGGFGLTGTDNVISCGSYTGNGSTSNAIDLGYEPQWVMIKRATGTETDWLMLDTMRGWTVSPNNAQLVANTAAGEQNLNSSFSKVAPSATGFFLNTASSDTNASGATYIYIAIRRGPMRTPTTGTSVFDPQTYTGNDAQPRTISTGFPVDAVFTSSRQSNNGFITGNRLFGKYQYLETAYTTAVTSNNSSYLGYDSNTSLYIGASGLTNNSAFTYIQYGMQRAPGFFDVVCYTGNQTSTPKPHNLGVIPELMIVKSRSAVNDWAVYSAALGATKYVRLNNTSAEGTSVVYWNDTAPTSTGFTCSIYADYTNTTGQNYVAYLFASAPGVSKVGSYTGTGTTLQVNCGFTGGARFVLIKRTDSTGDWYVWDSARGIVAGNDPYLLLNSTAAEVTSTDYVDTFASGFEISSTAPAAINASGGTYIFLAIA